MYIQKPLEVIFSFTTSSYIQQRVFNILVWFAFNGDNLNPFEGDHFIKIPLIKDMLHGDLKDNNDSYLRKSIISMAKNRYSYNIFTTKQTPSQTLNKSMFSLLNIKNNIVQYSIDKDFRGYFTKDTNLIFIYHKDKISLKSKYSLKLYELIKVSLCENIKIIPFDIFRKVMGIDGEYNTLSSFRKRVLNIAQSEILQHINIHIGCYINAKENTVSLYPRSIYAASQYTRQINILFFNASLFYNKEYYKYKGIFLSNTVYAYTLVVVSQKTLLDLVIKRDSIEELKLFVQKHLAISPYQ